MSPDPRSVRFNADELEAIAREAARLGITENGYVRFAVRRLARLAVPADVERQLLRDDIAAGRRM